MSFVSVKHPGQIRVCKERRAGSSGQREPPRPRHPLHPRPVTVTVPDEAARVATRKAPVAQVSAAPEGADVGLGPGRQPGRWLLPARLRGWPGRGRSGGRTASLTCTRVACVQRHHTCLCTRVCRVPTRPPVCPCTAGIHCLNADEPGRTRKGASPGVPSQQDTTGCPPSWEGAGEGRWGRLWPVLRGLLGPSVRSVRDQGASGGPCLVSLGC